jgi:hypothetical protein
MGASFFYALYRSFTTLLAEYELFEVFRSVFRHFQRWIEECCHLTSSFYV